MTFTLIPGAGGDAFYWHRVVPLLPDAIALDLPAGQDGAGLAEYAAVISGAIAGRDDVVLVAQSMGAYSAPIAATRDGVTMIDSGHLPALSRPDDLAQAILAA